MFGPHPITRSEKVEIIFIDGLWFMNFLTSLIVIQPQAIRMCDRSSSHTSSAHREFFSHRIPFEELTTSGRQDCRNCMTTIILGIGTTLPGFSKLFSTILLQSPSLSPMGHKKILPHNLRGHLISWNANNQIISKQLQRGKVVAEMQDRLFGHGDS